MGIKFQIGHARWLVLTMANVGWIHKIVAILVRATATSKYRLDGVGMTSHSTFQTEPATTARPVRGGEYAESCGCIW